ncbi:hypothetical protein CDL12_06136 [Handroanthus impetiginosus]|uniref:Rapid ALkalinization Factor n=1 Tax=Handroanthus impetiginosus TaxID=429701 RepID=A0A2G9HUH7_9LAMI|nr:hypothetical protein CDL12_06136 [Handroanthus impetiginosus]
MAKMLMVSFMVLLVVSAVVSSSSATDLGYGGIGNDRGVPGPPTPANPYKRGCERSERCRGDGNSQMPHV